MRGPPVVLTNTLGRPVTNVISERGAVPMVVVNTLGEPVTLVAQGGEPVTLFNANGTLWDYPFSLFANNEQGAWYDPSDFSTLFQNAAGTTPVTAVEQPVRLMLDRSGRGNHATAPNDASRPVLRARYNLLTNTDPLTGAAWQSIASGSAITTAGSQTDPLGGSTATQLTFPQNISGSGNFAVWRGNLVTTANGTYTFSVWLKAGTTTSVYLLLNDSGGNRAAVECTLTANWQRFTLTGTTAASIVSIAVDIGANGFIGSQSLTAGTISVWGAQLLTSADQTSTGGAYQRIAAATDYDTSNPVWRPYLAFDGTDDFFNLASAINITTDMTVVRGFGRSAAGIISAGVGEPADAAYDALWANDNKTYLKLGGTALNVSNGSTATGSFVISSVRNAASQFFRRNGSQISSVSAPAVSGTLTEFGRRGSSYNNGPIYGLIVLDRELTGSELTATEQWMAGKTGATLA